MSYDHNQRLVPESFLRLYFRNERLSLSRAELETRYELAEYIALHLADKFSSLADDDVVGQRNALRHTLAGLMTEPTSVSAGEAGWIVGRLSELCGWSAM